MHDDLPAQAVSLATIDTKKPKQANLRRRSRRPTMPCSISWSTKLAESRSGLNTTRRHSVTYWEGPSPTA